MMPGNRRRLFRIPSRPDSVRVGDDKIGDTLIVLGIGAATDFFVPGESLGIVLGDPFSAPVQLRQLDHRPGLPILRREFEPLDRLGGIVVLGFLVRERGPDIVFEVPGHLVRRIGDGLLHLDHRKIVKQLGVRKVVHQGNAFSSHLRLRQREHFRRFGAVPRDASAESVIQRGLKRRGLQSIFSVRVGQGGGDVVSLRGRRFLLFVREHAQHVVRPCFRHRGWIVIERTGDTAIAFRRLDREVGRPHRRGIVGAGGDGFGQPFRGRFFIPAGAKAGKQTQPVTDLGISIAAFGRQPQARNRLTLVLSKPV